MGVSRLSRHLNRTEPLPREPDVSRIEISPRPTLDAASVVPYLISQGARPSWAVGTAAVGDERCVVLKVTLGPIEILVPMEAAQARDTAGRLTDAVLLVEAGCGPADPLAQELT